MNVKEAYKVMQEASGINVGDMVKVLRKAKNKEMGWNCVWNPNMDSWVGGEHKVISVGSAQGIALEQNTEYRAYVFPFFILEVVEKAKIIRKEIRYLDENGKDVSDKISEETKKALG